jgi:predicted DNA-binding transcriptional regulator AlpA
MLNTIQTRQLSIPSELADVALIDAKTCAATGGMSVSQWHNLVREGTAPKPAIRLSRYTRWKVVDVREYFCGLVAAGSGDSERELIERAKKASMAAKAKRLNSQNTAVA